jgi:hypothetical protein
MQVSLRQVRVVSGCLGITSLVKPGGFAMVLRGMLVVLRCFGVVFRCLFCHFILRVFYGDYPGLHLTPRVLQQSERQMKLQATLLIADKQHLCLKSHAASSSLPRSSQCFSRE